MGALDVLILGAQFVAQRSDLGHGAAGFSATCRGCRFGLRQANFRCRNFFDDYKKKLRLGGIGRFRRQLAQHWPHTQIDQIQSVVGLYAQARHTNHRVHDHRFVQGCRQRGAKTFACHLEYIVDAGLAWHQFEVAAEPAMQVEHVAVFIDQGARGCDLLQQRLLGEFAQGQLGTGDRFAAGARMAGRVAHGGQERKTVHHGALHALKVLLALIQLGLAVEHAKQVAKVAHAFGGAQKQDATRFQCVVEQGNQPFLQLGAKVDQQVAAAQQIEPRERRVLDHVLLRENQHVADHLVHAVGAEVWFDGKETRQSLGADVGCNAERVETGAGGSNRATVDVGGENLHRVALFERLDALLHQDGDGIGFLAGRAAGYPDPQQAAGRLVGK